MVLVLVQVSLVLVVLDQVVLTAAWAAKALLTRPTLKPHASN